MAKTTKNAKKVVAKKATKKRTSKASTKRSTATKVSKKGVSKKSSSKVSKKSSTKVTRKAPAKTTKTKKKSTAKKKVEEPSLVREVSPKEPTTSYLNDSKPVSKKENILVWKIIAALVALLAIIFILIAISPSGDQKLADVKLTGEHFTNSLIVVTDSTCLECQTKDVIDVSNQLFGNLSVIVYDYATDKEAKELVEKSGAQVIPIYLFSKDIKENPNFQKVSQAMVDLGDVYMINPAATPGGKLLKEISVSPVKGNPHAKVKIIEWSDFECPYCAKFYSEGYKKIVTEYVDTGLVSIEFRHFPLQFHQNAVNAALASECAAEQGKFWEYHDKLYENSKALGIANLKAYAKDLSLDSSKFDTCLDTQKYKEKVDTDMQYGSIKGVSGTPGFLIGNQLVEGALPYEQFKQVIDAELAKVNS